MIKFTYSSYNELPISLEDDDVHLYVIENKISAERNNSLTNILKSYGLENTCNYFNNRTVYGKPFLSSEVNQKGIEFNLSHTQNICLLGITLHKRIGVDIEYRRFLLLDKDFLKNILTNKEQEYLARFAHDSQKSLYTFYHYWTRKEALLKGIGEGLQFGLKNIELDLSSTKLNAYKIESDHPLDYLWSVASFELKDSHVVAFAIKGKFSRVHIIMEPSQNQGSHFPKNI